MAGQHRGRSSPGQLATNYKVFAGVQLEEENDRLKKIVADLTLDREMLQDIVRRKL